MFNRLFRRKAQPEDRPPPAIPPGQRVYAIGDIHGRHDLFVELLAKIDADDYEREVLDTSLILLGDLVDRGPNSAQVVESARHIAEVAGPRARFIMGNHEEMFLAAAKGDKHVLRQFIKFGGRETILSYPISLDDYNAMDVETLADHMLDLIPREHVAFIDNFEPYVVMGDYLFTHAGIRPGVALEDQRLSDLRWIRDEFLSSPLDHGYVVVHGHTITDEPDVQANRIGIDTGGYYHGTLTAIGMEGTERWFLTAEGEPQPLAHMAEWRG